MINRRQFIQTTSIAGAIGLLTPTMAHSCFSKPTKGERTIRTITYNIRNCRGSTDVDSDPHLVRIARPQMAIRISMELALYEPDIVTFQESPKEPVVAKIAEQLNMNYVFFHGGTGNPGALLTHFPVMEYQNCPLRNYKERPDELFTRHWGKALLDTPVGKLAVYSAHLWPYQKGNNGREVTEIIDVMQTDIKNNQSLIFQGDLNHTPKDTEYSRWQNAGLIDAFAEGGSGIPFTCPNGIKHPTLNKRIDYIWASGPIASKAVQCRALYERNFMSHKEDPRSFSLSDHIPVMATFI